ncbi:hypothetical protein ACFQVD_07395 [Streptosporangium amethystogenes subsp. fukuiense]|uniref:Uncharacterized protein n=1 Tax=Streptosporangium amethystogenes subsp. fukuiense TaxID=698418 RepID=A0ABW2SV08_9ACTN
MSGAVPIQPVVDGDLVPPAPLDALRAGMARLDRSRRQVMIFDTESEVADDPLRPRRHLLREP